jgi:hypothetical protein
MPLEIKRKWKFSFLRLFSSWEEAIRSKHHSRCIADRHILYEMHLPLGCSPSGREGSLDVNLSQKAEVILVNVVIGMSRLTLKGA